MWIASSAGDPPVVMDSKHNKEQAKRLPCIFCERNFSANNIAAHRKSCEDRPKDPAQLNKADLKMREARCEAQNGGVGVLPIQRGNSTH